LSSALAVLWYTRFQFLDFLDSVDSFLLLPLLRVCSPYSLCLMWNPKPSCGRVSIHSSTSQLAYLKRPAHMIWKRPIEYSTAQSFLNEAKRLPQTTGSDIPRNGFHAVKPQHRQTGFPLTAEHRAWWFLFQASTITGIRDQEAAAEALLSRGGAIQW
jgi:hypothetical protein